MKKIWAGYVIILGLCNTTMMNVAQAVGVTLDAGSTGMGAHLILPIINQQLNARVGVNTFSYTYDGQASAVDYRFKLKLQTYDALFDYYPFSGKFRLTAGAVVNNTRVTADARPGDMDINGHVYSSEDVGRLSGRIDFKKYVPYVGVGWGNAAEKNKKWGFSSDIGVILQGSPRSMLQTNGCHVNSVACVQFQQDLDKENATFQDKAKNLQYYPVIRLGLSYQF